MSNRNAHRCNAKFGSHAEFCSFRNRLNEAEIKISKQSVNSGRRLRIRELLMSLNDASKDFCYSEEFYRILKTYKKLCVSIICVR